ncbi:ketoacyl-ACP synthase III family protein [Kitasatospora sp. NBC_01287]|uniref:ketoacyl-ACP synthase III family protein n=2 Tax=Kitasatospora sp. NBC_01287 TaxID=2903573 RepID=UPI00224E4F8A|nr:ketoacyl-ACP synthase III family protein [Kitasatospora sp. NBC_01287]MCX4748916.1 ketoacyl-ACP synthase III family protein [Kitasatospora sp. NBC_01287]
MRWENLYIAGLGAYLPEHEVTAEQAVAAGQYDAGRAEANGIHAVRVASHEETGPVMAAAAARQAIARSGHANEDFGLVLHSGMGHQGQDFWTPAHYVQNETVGGDAAAIEFRQGSNGGLAGVELAASYIVSRPDTTAALVTAGDSFKLPYVDRWNSDDQTVYGDGAGAIVLSTRGGFAKVRSTASISESSLEPIYRGTDWTDVPFESGRPADLDERKRSWLTRHESAYEEAMGRIGDKFAAVLGKALEDADTKLPDTQWFIHANVAQTIAEWGFYQPLGLDLSQTTYEWGKHLGHMGGGDHLIGLNHLFETGKPKAGDLVVAVGVGLGFMWTVAVIEVLDAPQW